MSLVLKKKNKFSKYRYRSDAWTGVQNGKVINREVPSCLKKRLYFLLVNQTFGKGYKAWAYEIDCRMNHYQSSFGSLVHLLHPGQRKYSLCKYLRHLRHHTVEGMNLELSIK